MDKKIVFPNGEGGVSVITPAPHWMDRLDDLAAKMVPDYVTLEPTGEYAIEDEDGNLYEPGEAPEVMRRINHGKVYEIIDAADLPDRESRNAWEWE